MDAQTFFHALVTYGWFIGPPIALVAVIFYVYRKSARARYRHDAEIPFEEGRHPHD
jgi:cbb3-type cytochrome oxidase subunit 3